jgi:hypothetical protein
MPFSTIVQTLREMCNSNLQSKINAEHFAKTIYEPLRDAGIPGADQISNLFQNFDANQTKEEACEADKLLQQRLNIWSTPENDAIIDAQLAHVVAHAPHA